MHILLGIGGLGMGFEMPSLANLSPLYKHRSRNVISSVENSAVKLMHGCRLLMVLVNCSRLSFVSVHTKNSGLSCITTVDLLSAFLMIMSFLFLNF